MTNVLTVQAKLDGDAAGLVGAAKKAASALGDLERQGRRLSGLSAKIADFGNRVGYAAGVVIRGAGQMGAALTRMSAMGVSAFASLISKATLAASALGTVFVGGALKSGLDRLMSIQDATVALTRMLGSAEAAASLTGEVLKVVQGTPFAFPQFAEASRQLVAFGVKAEKIPGVLKAIADSAAASGEGAEAVGRITQAFSRMAVTGKMSSDIIESLGSAGVNALGILGNHFGVSTAEAQAMVSDGLIPAEEAMQILVDGIEKGSTGIAGDFKSLAGAAQDLGKTISGSLGNVKAAFARMGAAWLKPFEKDFPAVLNDGVIPLLDKLGKAGAKMTQKLADTGVLQKVVTLFERMTEGVDPLISSVGKLLGNLSPLKIVWEALKDVLPDVLVPLQRTGSVIMTTLVPALADTLRAMVPLLPLFADLAPIIARAIGGALPIATDMLKLFVAVLQPLIGLLEKIPTPILGFAAALIGLQRIGVPVMGMIGEIGSALLGFATPSKEAGKALSGVADAADDAGGRIGAGGKLQGAMGGLLGFLAGPWGIALGVAAGAAVVLWDAMQVKGVAAVDALTQSLNLQTGALTDATKASVLKTLQDEGIVKQAKEYGIAVDTLVEASLGNADAQREVATAYDTAKTAYEKAKAASDAETGAGMEAVAAAAQRAGALKNVEEAVNGNNTALDEAREKWSDWAVVSGASATATESLRTAVDEATASIATNGATLDTNTAQGAANQAALEKVNTAASDLAETLRNTGDSTGKLTVAQQNSIGPLLDTYAKLGMNADAAANMAAEVLGIPKSRVVEVQGNFADAAAQAGNVAWAINHIPGYKAVVIETMYRQTGAPMGAVKAAYNAKGGLYNNGVKHFAGGGFNSAASGRGPGIAKGGANVMWAEKETGWEAYISGMRTQLQRNRRVWAEAGDRLGMFDRMSSDGGQQAGGISVTINGSDLDADTIVNMVISRLRFYGFGPMGGNS